MTSNSTKTYGTKMKKGHFQGRENRVQCYKEIMGKLEGLNGEWNGMVA